MVTAEHNNRAHPYIHRKVKIATIKKSKLPKASL